MKIKMLEFLCWQKSAQFVANKRRYLRLLAKVAADSSQSDEGDEARANRCVLPWGIFGREHGPL